MKLLLVTVLAVLLIGAIAGTVRLAEDPVPWRVTTNEER